MKNFLKKLFTSTPPANHEPAKVRCYACVNGVIIPVI